MSEWQGIETAPKDGTWFQAKIPGHGSDNVIAWADWLLDGENKECSGWHFMTDQEPPDDWTDGICCEVNEDGAKSTEPTHWKPLPEQMSADATNFRMERIQKLLNELRHEVERGIMEREIEEEIGFRFYVPISNKIPDGVVFCEFRTRPLPRHVMDPNDIRPRLQVVK